MIQVTKVWWDGEKLMAEPIDPTTIYQEPAQKKYWNAVSDAHIAAIKKSSKAMVEDAVVRAAQKVMAEFEAKSDERLMKDWGPGPHEYHSLPAQRTWVGLTDCEREKLRSEADEVDAGYRKLIKATEAKLKEKNT